MRTWILNNSSIEIEKYNYDTHTRELMRCGGREGPNLQPKERIKVVELDPMENLLEALIERLSIMEAKSPNFPHCKHIDIAESFLNEHGRDVS